MAVTDAPSLDFTTEDLLVLAELLDLPAPSGLGADPWQARPAEVRDYYRDAAVRSLAARRVLSSDGKDRQVVPAVRVLVEVLAEPGVLASVIVQDASRTDTAIFASQPRLSVEHTSAAWTVHRLQPFPTRLLVGQLLTAAHLPSSAPPATAGSATAGSEAESQPSVIPSATLDRVAGLARAGRRGEAEAALGTAGCRPDLAAALAAAL